MSADENTTAPVTLEDAARQRERAARELRLAEAEVERLRGPWDYANAAVRAARRTLTQLDDGMAAITQAHRIGVALRDVGTDVDGPLVVTRSAIRSHEIGFLVAVGPAGTGLYRFTPKRSGRNAGREHVIRAESGRRHDATEPARARHDLWEWQERGSGEFGQGTGSMKPKGPPEGGRWRWLRVEPERELEGGTDDR